ncbi:Transposon Tf2-6 polyprotein like [Argiope bruennichi]|uniref:RNA-directed DNA polymerase n=1 Tax=Argiope bruennichi TaxID=94029 RepID=A0A8T0FW51_ARGBR|nr:Transposon Tf2-6 polyprotein like [Argiope bruennichi]
MEHRVTLNTLVNLEVEGKVIPTELIVLPEEKGNRILLGTYFLQSAGIVLGVLKGKWHFCEKPQIQYSFCNLTSNYESCSVADSKEKIAEMSNSIQVPKTTSIINLRSDEEPPYRMNPSKKELDTLLADGIIEECESPYASPFVLVPKPNEEHVIEYASGLLIPAEHNYSTTEREVLAVVWALEKVRGYVEKQEIIIASDHQPLKWLMSIKSPSGLLARWALQIQYFTPNIEYIPSKSNGLADMLSRPTNLNEDVPFEVFSISADIPVRRPRCIREEQLKDEELKMIIDCIMYRYLPEVETEEAQLVVPVQERGRVLQEYHDVSTAGHYGTEGTYNNVACRYNFPGMRKYIEEYVENCPDCNLYKPSNQNPTGLLRTPVYAQRFETLAIDLFGPLPGTSSGKKWIFLLEDTSTKWLELFALEETISGNCAKTLVEEVFLRYGLPRRLQDFIPVYRPQSNPSERKNRDLKPRLAILVRNEHDTCDEKLTMIRFALNTAKCEITNHTADYLQFGREFRTTDDVTHDIRALIDNDNFVAEITPYLKRFARLTAKIEDHVEEKQDKRKVYYDRRHEKFFTMVTDRSPPTYDIADPAKPDEVLGIYHISALRAYELPVARDSGIVAPLRRRGRPKTFRADSSPRRRASHRGSL